MGERNTRIRANQIRSILPNDLEATNARVDNYIPSYDEAEEKYTWVPNAAGASNIEELGDVDFDSGTPIDGYSLVYDDVTSKWKAELISGGDFSDGGEAGGADRKIGNTDNYDLSLLTNNLSRVHIQNDGKVGIGIDAPDSLFHISGSGSEIARIQSSSGSGWIRFNEGAVARGYIGFSDPGALLASMDADSMAIRAKAGLFLATNGDNIRIAIKADGKVGIGETVPGAKLDVNGDLLLQAGTTVNEFSIDGLLAGNSDDAIPTEKAIKTYSDVIDDKTVKNQDNIMINAFRIAVNGSLTQFNMLDGIVDEYEDESGIDTVNSLNESYNSANDYYSPTGAEGLTVSPYAHYKCNDNTASTVVTDNGTGSNNGVANVNTSNYSVAGKINQAFELNGTTEYINLDALEADIGSDTSGSFSLWIKPDVSASGVLLAFGETTGLDIFKFGYGSNDVYLICTPVDPEQLYVVTTNGDIVEGEWNHIVLVQDGASPKIYLNSVLQTLNEVKYTNPGNWFSSIPNIDNGRIGCDNWNNKGNAAFYDGSADDLRYYQNKALTQAEIDAIYNSGNGTEDDQPSGDPTNMTLISDIFTAESAPDTARAVILEEDVDAITLNTDLKAYASRDSGANWVQGTLSDEGDYDASKRILVADFTLAGSGVNMEYKLTTLNNKDLKIHASALNWD